MIVTKQFVNVTCPTRVDLSGGTLDLWPIYTILEQAYILNSAINLNTDVNLKKHSHPHISLKIAHLKYQERFSSLKDILSSYDKEIGLVQKVLDYFKPDFGFDLHIKSTSPIGAGLGGSSSLLIGLLKTFDKVLNRQRDILSYVQLAHNIESSFLGQPTGTQDYFMPVLGTGTVLISYNKDGVSYKHLETPSIVKEKCMLVYTGKSHQSGWNNWKVLKNFIDGDVKTRKVLERIAEVSKQVYLQFLNQDLDQDLDQDSNNLKELFDEEFKARVSLTEAFSSPEINQLRKWIPDHSALKICGAGGGGCVMIWTDHKDEISKICSQKGYQVLNAKVL